MSFTSSVRRPLTAASHNLLTKKLLRYRRDMSSIIAVKPDGTPVTSTAPTTASLQSWQHAGTKGTAFETRLFYAPEGVTTAAVGVGKKEPKTDIEKAERSRRVAAVGAQALKGVGAKEVEVDPVYSSHAAATGATLATYNYVRLNHSQNEKAAITKTEALSFKPLGSSTAQLPTEKASGKLIGLDFETGLVYGQAQNLARSLAEAPANYITPTKFCEKVQEEFKGLENVEIFVRDQAWAESQGMRTFLSVARGTEEPCKFLEIHYKGASTGSGSFKPPLAFVGKGITFDSGGISLKPGAGMKLMRADMGGAAATVSAAWAIAKLRVPIDIVICTPLTENMPSGHATKPGDIITAMNGKTVEVDNTDAEGRLVLSDALYYASSVYKPDTIIDVATLTGAMAVALGETLSGVFSTSESLWSEIEAAGKIEQDLVWRMPFSDEYMKLIDGTNADLCNTGGRYGGSCTAAIFLREFVDGLACNAPEGTDQEEDTIRYAHIDIAGTMETTRPDAYLTKGMSGRPVRTLIEFARQFAATK